MKTSLYAIASVLAWYLPAMAASPASPVTLAGTYAVAGSGSCLAVILTADGAFDSNLQPTRAYSLVSFTVEGTWHFGGDGTGIANETVLSTVYDQSNGRVAHLQSHTATSPFSYTVSDDGKFQTRAVSYLGTVTAGPGLDINETFTVYPVEMQGQISSKSQNLTMETPGFETELYNYEGIGVAHLPGETRLCHRAQIGILIGK